MRVVLPAPVNAIGSVRERGGKTPPSRVFDGGGGTRGRRADLGAETGGSSGILKACRETQASTTGPLNIWK